MLDRKKTTDLIELMDQSEKDKFIYGIDPNRLFQAFDENKDGVIDSEDAGYNFLFVWQDANQDMITQPEEVQSLASFNINIDLTNKPIQCLNNEGSCKNTFSSYGNLMCYDDSGAMEMHGVTLLHYV